MKTSETFMDIFTNHGGSPCIECQFCKRVHFTHEDQDYVELQVKARAEPDKYLESGDDSIGWGYLDGRQYVFKCPCDSGARYEHFIWRHRESIIEYLKRRIADNKAEADAEAKMLGGL